MNRGELYKIVKGCEFHEGVSQLTLHGYRIVEANPAGVKIRKGKNECWIRFAIGTRGKIAWIVGDPVSIKKSL